MRTSGETRHVPQAGQVTSGLPGRIGYQGFDRLDRLLKNPAASRLIQKLLQSIRIFEGKMKFMKIFPERVPV
jgi:hypothetical protein